jgi:hypothetical protein
VKYDHKEVWPVALGKYPYMGDEEYDEILEGPSAYAFFDRPKAFEVLTRTTGVNNF